MSNAWENTPDDVIVIFAAHGRILEPDTAWSVHDAYFLDEASIEDAALAYTDPTDQCTAAFSVMEDILITAGELKGPKQFRAP